MMDKLAYLYLNQGSDDILVGTLRFQTLRGKEVCSFAYDPEYLLRPSPLNLDASLFLESNYQYYPDGLFPFLNDLMPDRWGRALIERERRRNGDARTLLESDYLLSVDDKTRVGALRLKQERDGPFLASSTLRKIPPELFLNHLEEIARAYENGEDISDNDFKDLLEQGSSLGGARPKATIYTNEGDLCIAKFPHRHDEYDLEGFEKLVNDLAGEAGINVPESSLRKASRHGSIFLAKRFDRDGDGRIHYASAMSLLGARDGDDSWGYLDLADLIRNISTNPKEDLRELFRRVAFNIAIRNGDDHLRNHGFLHKDGGYRLSPAFDLNPSRSGSSLHLCVDQSSKAMSFSLLLSTCESYFLSKEEGSKIIETIKKTVSERFIPHARKLGLAEKEISSFSGIADFSDRL